MRLSTRGRYALEAMLALALLARQQPVSLKTISAWTGLSHPYLEHLFAAMKQAGLVQSERGSRGGYCLAVDAAILTTGSVLRAAEGSLAPVHCLAPAAEKRLTEQPPITRGSGVCERMPYCRSRPVWSGLDQTLTRFLDRLTLADLIKGCLEEDATSS